MLLKLSSTFSDSLLSKDRTWNCELVILQPGPLVLIWAIYVTCKRKWHLLESVWFSYDALVRLRALWRGVVGGEDKVKSDIHTIFFYTSVSYKCVYAHLSQ